MPFHFLAVLLATSEAAGRGWIVTVFILGAACVVLLIVMFRHMLRIDGMNRKMESLQQKNDAVSSFLQSQGKALNETSESILGKILEAAINATHAGAGAIYILPPDSKTMRATELRGFFPPIIPPSKEAGGKVASKLKFWRDLALSQEVPISEGIFEELFAKTSGINIHQAEMEPRLFQADDPALRVRNLLAVPLRYDRITLGAIILVNKTDQLGTPTTFSEDDLTMLQTLALHAGFSIQTSRHFQELAEKRRLDFDLDVARDIQRLLLPKHWPKVPGLEIAGKSNAAQQVGGDYLDVVPINDYTIAFAIADVSGKGVPGALMMSIFRTQVRSRAKFHPSPSALLREINLDMASEIRKGMFISTIYGIIDLQTFTVRFARAGHPPPVLFRKQDHTLHEIDPEGIAIGVGDEELFARHLDEAEVQLHPGDAIAFYTDGVTEAQNADGNEFGLPDFLNAIRRSASQGAQGILQHVAHHLTRFAVGVPQQDDITLLIFSRPDPDQPVPISRNGPLEEDPQEPNAPV